MYLLLHSAAGREHTVLGFTGEVSLSADCTVVLTHRTIQLYSVPPACKTSVALKSSTNCLNLNTKSRDTKASTR